jgi:very-short-patch-repair endonuclease
MELLFLLIPLGILLLAFFLRGDSSFRPPDVSPISKADLKAFEAAPSLFVNGAEMALFRCLAEALPAQLHLHSKVRVEDIIRVKRGIPQAARWAARGRVKSRHVDFLITTMRGDIVMAIELDGASHDPKAPSEADKVKTALFQAAKIPLRRIRVGEDFRRIAALIRSEIAAS